MATGNPYPNFDVPNPDATANDGDDLANLTATVNPYSHKHAPTLMSGTERAAASGPIRSAEVRSLGTSPAPYTKKRPRSSKPREDQVQPPTVTNGAADGLQKVSRTTSSAEEWNQKKSIYKSEPDNSVGQMATAVAGSSGLLPSRLLPTLIMKTEAVEFYTNSNLPAQDRLAEIQEQEAQTWGTLPAFQNPPGGTQMYAWQSSPSTTTAPWASTMPSNPSAGYEVPQTPGERPLAFYSGQNTAGAAYQGPPMSFAAAAIQRMDSHTTPIYSGHYYCCSMQKCKLQHWNGTVRHHVKMEVGRIEGPTSRIWRPEGIDWDLLVLHSSIATRIHDTLEWPPAREIHLRSLSSVPRIDASGQDLTTLIPNLAMIPGSLQALVMAGGVQFHDELRKQVRNRGKILNVAIGNALQLCGLVICDEFWRQLETEKTAIEIWRKGFYVELFDMNTRRV